MIGRRTWSKPASVAVLAGVYSAAAAAGWATAESASAAGTLAAALAADLAATAVVFAASVTLDNTSVYDPYWSVAPLFIAMWWAAAGDGTPARTAIILVLLGLWGTRLTANFLIGWKGLDHEDWRYSEYRRFGMARYWAVSLVGLHLMPTLVVFGALLPLHAALTEPAAGLGITDALAVLIALAALGVESAADRAKRRFSASARPKAILDTGVWAWSRHPNYLGEVGFWWGMFGFAVAVGPGHLWTVIGPVGMTALFWFVSIPLMDRRMLERRPGYRRHLEQMPALVPRVGPMVRRVSRATSRK